MAALASETVVGPIIGESACVGHIGCAIVRSSAVFDSCDSASLACQ